MGPKSQRHENQHKKVLVFGPQALSFDVEDLRRLITTASNLPEWPWILQAISELADYWDAFTDELPRFNITTGQQQLRDLHEWFSSGTASHRNSKLSNLLLSPLVVVSHIVEFLTLASPTLGGVSDGISIYDDIRGTLGLCTGILSAFAVSLSENAEDLRNYATRAIRLAMLIGGVVDSNSLQDTASEEWQALTTVWVSPECRMQMELVLKSFPKAYISVDFDENRATVTAPAGSIAALREELGLAGVKVFAIGLRGAFHNEIYAEQAKLVAQYCDAHPQTLTLPRASTIVHPTLYDSTTTLDDEISLHTHALQAMLVQRSRWIDTFKYACELWLDDEGEGRLICFGPERCIPPSMGARLTSRVVQTERAQPLLRGDKYTATSSLNDQIPVQSRYQARKADDIAIVGAAIKTSGADDTNDFWALLCEAESQHELVPESRFKFESLWREMDKSRKWFGNFVNDHDTFDHKFFKKSAREAASTDPQHRQMLQVAYQAVQQSGYFNIKADERENNVGCFIGSCTGDYEHNVACYQPNAFTAVGNLRGFPAGKISHYFGWTGPSICLDTACSSSLVAIHQACQSILAGECAAALAGGTNIMTYSGGFDNLAAASFLSPTGQCKPFDAKADGYCRGEGVVAVYLKKMSSALAEGDQILATISSTAVMQNQNCTPIFVPHSGSLSQLFAKTLHKAQLKADEISYVEAHGTGTQVGDPAEYQSIREILGGSNRSRPISLGSVKGLIGHTEGASGGISLLKSLLMLHYNAIPRQPSFETLNPGILATSTDNIEIATSLKAWDANGGQVRSILINNYGASGSNASMIVSESPVQVANRNYQASASAHVNSDMPLELEHVEMPFRLFGHDDPALRRASTKLRRFLTATGDVSMADLSYNVTRQCNPTLDKLLTFSSRSSADLLEKLAAFEASSAAKDIVSFTPPAEHPIILCFGGQVSTSIGLDKAVYYNCDVFRHHLDKCDALYRSLSVMNVGNPSLFPEIFEDKPVDDVVRLQVMLFSTQYACAMSWIECGARPVAVVGHSFGELTAVCVSGMLGLRDALAMIIARATIVREHWGSEPGAMMAVEAPSHEIERLIGETKRNNNLIAGVACINGPTSFTLAGSSAGINAIADIAASDSTFTSVRLKMLNVTNAFHSALVEPLIPLLQDVGESFSFNRPTIPLESTARNPSGTDSLKKSTASCYLAEHMRNPVRFYDAVKTLSAQHPSAIWLEAGTNSTITNMASRALGAPKTSHFQAINISRPRVSGDGLQQLTNATINLWKQGLRHLTHWSHHRSQAHKYAPLLLPPYQFEPARHWMDLKSPALAPGLATIEQTLVTAPSHDVPQTLWSFVKWTDTNHSRARFSINTSTAIYQDLVSGHVIADTAPICPATVELDIVIDALTSVHRFPSGYQSQIRRVNNQAAVCHSPSRQVWLDIECMDDSGLTWEWKFSSTDGSAGAGGASTIHATGQVTLVSPGDEAERHIFDTYSRLKTHSHCLEILDEQESADDVFQGRGIYKTFNPVVNYGKPFQGLQRLVGRKTESAGRLFKRSSGKTWFDAHLADCFCQVGGIWVNCMTDCDAKDMYIATGIEKWTRSPEIQARPDVEAWDVLANHHIVSKQTILTDIFVFDPQNGALVEVILGINYHRVAKASLSRMLVSLSQPGTLSHTALPVAPMTQGQVMTSKSVAQQETINTRRESGPSPNTMAVPPSTSNTPKVESQVRDLIADLSGLEPDEIADDAELADLGIDSLMGMELSRELGGLFKIELPTSELNHITNFRSLVDLVKTQLGSTEETNGAEVILAAASSASGESVNGSDDHGRGYESTTTQASSYVADDDESKKSVIIEELQIEPQLFEEAVRDCNQFTDKILADYGCNGYAEIVLPEQNKLCIMLAVEAFEQMGCSLATAETGEVLKRVTCIPKQQKLCDYLYSLLEDEAHLVKTDGTVIKRTNVSVSTQSSDIILEDLLPKYPEHACANKLTYFTGRRLADVLRGDCDGIQLIFGSEEGRKLVADMYGGFLLNQVANVQMGDIILRLISKISKCTKGKTGPLRIMELGAGTGGTTTKMVELLANLDIPVKYTFTDLSGSFVAAARKRFKKYPFMDFRVHDIEKPPADDLLGTQHIVIASNAIHATHNLVRSTENIRKALRPDGSVLMMMEMMRPLHWVDVVFGLFEGWWLFDDGRDHAVASESAWQTALHSAGYSSVHWTDGNSPEIKLERVLVALNSNSQSRRYYRPSPNSNSVLVDLPADVLARKTAVDNYVRNYTQNFLAPAKQHRQFNCTKRSDSACVVVTGGTGSLGAHLVAQLASITGVAKVVCLNRRSTTAADPMTRQRDAFRLRAISVSRVSVSKLQVLETDTRRPYLGLPDDDYQDLARNVTHILHNAWPMTSKRDVSGLEAQFSVMRNLIDLAHAAGERKEDKITFVLVSSIAAVGHYPLWNGGVLVPEERMNIESVLPNGYGDAKFVCERMLDETLHLYPSNFRAMSVRPGQIAGSSTSGYWNSQEHLPFLLKSSQTLKALPRFEHDLYWTPVNQVAGTLCDLALSPQATNPIYHIDNPVGQPWEDMISDLTTLLKAANDYDNDPILVVPFSEWLERVREFPGDVRDNPAAQLVDFLDNNFVRMSCGGLRLDTALACRDSPTLAAAGPVGRDVVKKYVDYWRETGFLS
ncbi:putative polyketide synthase [Xylariaceae sp. FL1651]|nr:putative polyketide synthase [Xylariaceae sp. FL1651]